METHIIIYGLSAIWQVEAKQWVITQNNDADITTLRHIQTVHNTKAVTVQMKTEKIIGWVCLVVWFPYIYFGRKIEFRFSGSLQTLKSPYIH